MWKLFINMQKLLVNTQTLLVLYHAINSQPPKRGHFPGCLAVVGGDAQVRQRGVPQLAVDNGTSSCQINPTDRSLQRVRLACASFRDPIAVATLLYPQSTKEKNDTAG